MIEDGGLWQKQDGKRLNFGFGIYKGVFGMKTINEIKSIEITLEEDNIFKMDFNGYKEQEGYNLIIPKDNALRVARTLTRMANMIWEKYDIIANEKMGKEE